MVIKTYTTETPLNSAALTPNRPFVSASAMFSFAILIVIFRCCLVVVKKLWL